MVGSYGTNNHMEFKKMNLLKSFNMLLQYVADDEIAENPQQFDQQPILAENSANSDENINDPAFHENEENNDESLYKWELTVSKAYASRTKSQVLHFPPKTAQFVLRDKEYLIIDTPHQLSDIRCTIKTYARKNKDKRRKNIVEKYLTKGWYNWVLANKLNKGDKLIFELQRGSNILHVDIVRFKNYQDFMTCFL
ncbi:hypothetical protein L195_g010995 [Trifolium pratense]|uniref:TF-B3 domain-containing protein n=1 Tax=Trifolium pratense TaxID=57577 RepID=A0A2K3PG97_TRIPR|nr:hypothetical protein L195_g010995 [Trifolium pratense]